MATQRNRATHFLVTPDYLMTRDAALHFPATHFRGFLPTKDSVYGAVIDIPLDPRTIMTLVIYINGSANLYFNNGRTYTGASSRYPKVAQLAGALVGGSARILPDMTRTKIFDIPTGQEHHIFLLTQNGTYKKSILPANVKDESRNMQAFCVLYQRLVAELYTAQHHDSQNNLSKN